MAKSVKRICPACGVKKTFRIDQKTCGCVSKLRIKEKVTTTDKTLEINLPSTTIHTLDQLIAAFEVDLSIWSCKRFVANKWEVVMTPPAYTEEYRTKTGNPWPAWQRDKENTQPLHESLYQVKAFFEKKTNIVDAKREIEELKTLAKSNAAFPKSNKIQVPSSGNMLEINLTDHHFGKLAWGAETGASNYDVKIAKNLFNRALENIIQRASSFKFEEIWFVVGNDLMNSDDAQGRTTGGTHVSTDIRYHKTFSTVRNIMISAIERLRLISKVKVIMVSGNHDHLSVWQLGDSLECFFHNYKDVTIDNSPRYYKYHQFGKIMVMYTHGDKGKRPDYPLLMATEQPKMFGATKFREAHTGHLHHNKVEEYHGIIVRILPALCPPDAWHAENTFVGNLRSSEAFIWNKDEGLIGTIIYTDSDDNIEKSSDAEMVVG